MPQPVDLPPVTLVEVAGVAAEVPADRVRVRLTNIRGPATTTRIAEIARGDKRLVVVAPWFQGGELVDDDVAGFLYTKTAAGWAPVGDALSLTHGDGRAEVVAALGAEAEWAVTRRCGAPASELGTRANDAIARFATGVLAKDTPAMAGAWTDFAALWALGEVAFDDTPTSMLQGAAHGGAPFVCTGAETPTCGITMGPNTLPLRVERCGEGWVLAGPESSK
ncbi:MAG: hypothetical protein Q8P41_27235 [Pseudomonadota bacterium]|nr:hypothetical protein [Pseudomonadota bacterium]